MITESLIEAHVGLCRSIAERSNMTDKAEAFSICLDVLWRQSAKYDPAKGVPFVAFFTQKCNWVLADKLRIRSEQRRKFEKGTVSLNAPINGYDDVNFESVVAAEAPEELPVSELMAALSTLTERERMVVEMRCGLNGYDSAITGNEVGKTLGLTESRISQIFNKACRTMRRRLCNSLQL